MKYQKPEVVALASACAAVRSVSKAMSTPDSTHQPSVTAYEADE